MKSIPLTQDKFTLVDDADFECLNQFRWHARKDKNTFYAARGVRFSKGQQKQVRIILMHRDILGLCPNDGIQSDHIDGIGLNNQRINLRRCTHQQNNCNQRPQRHVSSRFKGVYWKRNLNKWAGQITVNRRHVHLGYFDKEEDAGKTYNEAALRYFGKFARLNIINSGSLSSLAAGGADRGTS